MYIQVESSKNLATTHLPVGYFRVWKRSIITHYVLATMSRSGFTLQFGSDAVSCMVVVSESQFATTGSALGIYGFTGDHKTSSHSFYRRLLTTRSDCASYDSATFTSPDPVHCGVQTLNPCHGLSVTWPQCSIHWHICTFMFKLLVSHTPTLWYLSRVTHWHSDSEFASTNGFIDRPNSDNNTTLRLVNTHHYVPLRKSQSTGMIHWHSNRPWDQSHCWPNELEQEKFASDLSLSRKGPGCSAGDNNNNCNIIWRKPDILTNSTVAASGWVMDFRSDPMGLYSSRSKL